MRRGEQYQRAKRAFLENG